jgi:hypothetical protein
MDNFDLRKYLVENKVTTNSRMINEQENTKYFQLGYNYGPNAKLNIDPNMPEWKTISQLANDLYNTGVPLNSLEQNNAAVEFTKGYIASIATNSVRYQGLSSIINALGSVEENGHRENYLPGAEMMKEEEDPETMNEAEGKSIKDIIDSKDEEAAKTMYASLLKNADQAEMQAGADPAAADYLLKAIYDDVNKLKAAFPNLKK